MIITALIISILVVVITIVSYHSITGIWPGGRLVIEDPPAGVSGLSDDQAKFIFFSTDWCPFSQKAKDPWVNFKQEMLNTSKTFGGKTIVFEEVDCDAQKGRAAMFNVREYPTFKLQTKEKVYRMCGNPSVASFKAFLRSSLGSESS